MKNVIVTGCAGFIGSHLAKHYLEKGDVVHGIDNLSRNGCSTNLEILSTYKNFAFYKQDIRDFAGVSAIFQKAGKVDLIIHEAGQVAVTTSVINPREDFEINALGTFNMLEATRLYAREAMFQFASTNKVYGKMADVEITEKNGRYEYEKLTTGISENYGLEFYSPYGCSKGAADQYVRDYSRIYGLKTVVFRQSCIYGTRQFGIEDQGWVAWFTIASILKKPITIYGDGKQIRDILWIDDLVELYASCFENSEKVSGKIFNVGGGPKNTLSLLELVKSLQDAGIMQDTPAFSDERPGDQKVFVSDISLIKDCVGWEPKTTVNGGLHQLIQWSANNKGLLESILK
jgi:CDP-paratose 2-epimerase